MTKQKTAYWDLGLISFLMSLKAAYFFCCEVAGALERHVEELRDVLVQFRIHERSTGPFPTLH